jgi:flagellin-like hook-associated protein FlgL
MSTVYRTNNPAPTGSSDWPAVTVALGILILLGAILVTATARWTAADLKELVGTLAPVLGVVTGAFVTYFFTRQATATATNAAQVATATAATAAQAATDTAARTTDAAQAQLKSQTEQLESQIQRARALHNALTAAFGMVDQATAEKMRQDRTIGGVL